MILKFIILLLLNSNISFCCVYDEWLIKTTTDGSLNLISKLKKYDGISVEKIDDNTFLISSNLGTRHHLETILNTQLFIQTVERQRCDNQRIFRSKRREFQCYLDKHIPNHLIQCRDRGNKNMTSLSDGDFNKIIKFQEIGDRESRLWTHKDISTSFNKFSLDLFQQISSKKASNTIISPYSIASALSMCYAGARGTTEFKLGKLLNYLHLSNDQIHSQNHQLIQTLLHLNGKVALKVANKLFTNSLNSKFSQTFLNLLQNSYNSEIEALDYRRPQEASKTINDWVMEKSENLIKDLISEQSINSQVKAILVNAIYFKGTWVYKFDPKLTSKENFYLSDGTVRLVETMKLYKKKLKLKINPDGIQAVTCEFPYVGDQIAMTIILPDEGISINEVQSSLNNAVLSTIFDDYSTRIKVNAYIPKFKFEQSIELSDHLSKMGVEEIFDPIKANFTGMTDENENLFISKVLHKAIVEVNESGTEAAAASAVVIVTRSAMFEQEPYEFKCNREFLFIIHDKQKNQILFMGRYAASISSS